MVYHSFVVAVYNCGRLRLRSSSSLNNDRLICWVFGRLAADANSNIIYKLQKTKLLPQTTRCDKSLTRMLESRARQTSQASLDFGDVVWFPARSRRLTASERLQPASMTTVVSRRANFSADSRSPCQLLNLKCTVCCSVSLGHLWRGGEGCARTLKYFWFLSAPSNWYGRSARSCPCS